MQSVMYMQSVYSVLMVIAFGVAFEIYPAFKKQVVNMEKEENIDSVVDDSGDSLFKLFVPVLVFCACVGLFILFGNKYINL